jgi:hypothetical protein
VALCSAACVAAVLVASADARAQVLDLQVKTSHSAYAAGMPQVFPTTATTQPNGQPTFYGGAPATVYSLTGTFANGEAADAVSLGQTTVAQFLANNPNVQLIPASSGYSHTYSVHFETDRDFADAKPQGELRLVNECENLGDFNVTSGFPTTTVGHPCDAIEATLTLNGVAFNLTGAENSTGLRLAIPSIGYDFTAPGSNLKRIDSLSQIADNVQSGPKAQVLAARLMGRRDDFIPPKALPNEGELIKGSITVGEVTKTFGVATPGALLGYAIAFHDLDARDFGIPYDEGCARGASGAVTGVCSAASAVLSVAGVEVRAASSANSPDISFSAPDLGLDYTSTGASDRASAIKQFADYAEENVDRSKLVAAYARYLAAHDPSNPLVGNPYSAQGQLVRGVLDLDQPSQALGETKGRASRGRDVDPSGWMVGGRAGYLSGGGAEAAFVDAVAERGFRVREGSRMRFKVSLPVSYADYGSSHGGGRAATLGVRTSLEVPLLQDRWVVEPAASAAAFYSDGVISSGALYLVGVSSRFKLAHVGRGHIVIGNAVTYSSSLHIEAGDFATPKIQNTAFRNGIAYQVPYGRVLGRQGTVRASYSFTHLEGDDVLTPNYHEVSLSYGVAGREAAVKQLGETLRLGVTGAFGHRFTAVSLNAGYRF